MSVLSIRLRSEAMNRHVSFNVIHPDDGEGPFPVLMQLHGYSDDHHAWLLNSRLVQHVRELPLIVVMPDGGTSRYLNLLGHERFGVQRYEDLLMQDIPAEIERLFHVRPGKWAIGGLSMGGFGSMRLGLKFPDRFCSIWAHSSGVRPLDETFIASLEDPNDIDIAYLASKALKTDSPPVLSLDCGTEDELIEHNRDLHRALTELGYEHDYREHPGAHTWDYWDEHVVEALAQHARVLGIRSILA